MSAQDQQNSDRIVRNIDYLQVLKNRWKEVFLVFLLVLVISVGSDFPDAAFLPGDQPVSD